MNLLKPIKVGKITLKNRIMFPPMTTGYKKEMVQSVNKVLISINV